MKFSTSKYIFFSVFLFSVIAQTPSAFSKNKYEDPYTTFYLKCDKASQAYKNKNYDIAVTYYQQADLIYDEQPELKNNLGLACLYLGWYTSAEDYLKQAIEISDIQHNMSLLYLNLNWYSSAEDYMKRSIDNAWQVKSSKLILLSSIYNRIGEDDLALTYLNKAIDMDPDNLNFLEFKGIMNMKRGNYKEALSLLQESSIDSPSMESPFTNIAFFY